MSANIQDLENKFRDYKRAERHRTMAEALYWIDRYKNFAQMMMLELRSALAQKEAAAHGDERAAFEEVMQRHGYNMTMCAGMPSEYAFPPMIAAWKSWQARAALAQPVAVDAPTHKSLTAHFSPFYLLSNARLIVSKEIERSDNWVLAMKLFAVGSTTARRICDEAGIDPDSKVIQGAIDAQDGEAT